MTPIQPVRRAWKWPRGGTRPGSGPIHTARQPQPSLFPARRPRTAVLLHAGQKHAGLLWQPGPLETKKPNSWVIGRKEVNFHESPGKKAYLKKGNRAKRERGKFPGDSSFPNKLAEPIKKKKSIALNLLVIHTSKNQTLEKHTQSNARIYVRMPTKKLFLTGKSADY